MLRHDPTPGLGLGADETDVALGFSVTSSRPPIASSSSSSSVPLPAHPVLTRQAPLVPFLVLPSLVVGLPVVPGASESEEEDDKADHDPLGISSPRGGSESARSTPIPALDAKQFIPMDGKAGALSAHWTPWAQLGHIQPPGKAKSSTVYESIPLPKKEEAFRMLLQGHILKAFLPGQLGIQLVRDEKSGYSILMEHRAGSISLAALQEPTRAMPMSKIQIIQAIRDGTLTGFGRISVLAQFLLRTKVKLDDMILQPSDEKGESKEINGTLSLLPSPECLIASSRGDLKPDFSHPPACRNYSAHDFCDEVIDGARHFGAFEDLYDCPTVLEEAHTMMLSLAIMSPEFFTSLAKVGFGSELEAKHSNYECLDTQTAECRTEALRHPHFRKFLETLALSRNTVKRNAIITQLVASITSVEVVPTIRVPLPSAEALKSHIEARFNRLVTDSRRLTEASLPPPPEPGCWAKFWACCCCGCCARCCGGRSKVGLYPQPQPAQGTGTALAPRATVYQA
ncbi:hypothetical protein BH10PSE19_BH10PSE19_12410 [soil metagenome]